ncbi:prevent-host-death protein [Chlorobaculum thiosulfatiphilum]|uniref:Prevent-host-death protein n=1 Tax=Chlorobaculum thiosulfatiphilum TaxID=115852 RepID=A0A5C4S6V7_CHLTI|nr:YlcI/YnfO family protein [Chlorobaculum thiosulfatiphilum]TNJ38857.1 prevent-host-death protein [Chlorobaculum thiosulfatiphilum]
MKSVSLPSLRVEPELRKAVEEVLRADETLSSFMEDSIRANIERRLSQKEFIARGLTSRDRAIETGEYVDAGAVLDRLELMLNEVKEQRS